MKNIIACGHTASGQIGCGAVDKLDESNCTREIGPFVVKYLEENGSIAPYIRIDKGNAYNCQDCYDRCELAKNIGGDTYNEIHINAGGDGATGVEVLLNSLDSVMFDKAIRVCANISKALGIPNRGVKQQNLIVLKRTPMPAMLIECCFTGNPDASLYDADVIAKAIAGGILGIELSSSWKQGWNPSNGKWWYSPDPINKTYYKNEWQFIDGFWYLFDSLGWAITGWKQYITQKEKIEHWYYLDAATCKMAVGWKQINDKWYFFNNDGEMQTGWIKDNCKDYCLYSSGAMISNCDMYGYRFDSNGVATKL